MASSGSRTAVVAAFDEFFVAGITGSSAMLRDEGAIREILPPAVNIFVEPEILRV